MEKKTMYINDLLVYRDSSNNVLVGTRLLLSVCTLYSEKLRKYFDFLAINKVLQLNTYKNIDNTAQY